MFEGLDMGQLMAEAARLQEEMARAQQEQAARTFDGSAGGGLVGVTISGDGDLVGLRISAEAWDPEDTDVLAELIIAAFRGAREQAEAAMRAGMPSMPQLPEGFGF